MEKEQNIIQYKDTKKDKSIPHSRDVHLLKKYVMEPEKVKTIISFKK